MGGDTGLKFRTALRSFMRTNLTMIGSAWPVLALVGSLWQFANDIVFRQPH